MNACKTIIHRCMLLHTHTTKHTLRIWNTDTYTSSIAHTCIFIPVYSYMHMECTLWCQEGNMRCCPPEGSIGLTYWYGHKYRLPAALPPCPEGPPEPVALPLCPEVLLGAAVLLSCPGPQVEAAILLPYPEDLSEATILPSCPEVVPEATTSPVRGHLTGHISICDVSLIYGLQYTNWSTIMGLLFLHKSTSSD